MNSNNNNNQNDEVMKKPKMNQWNLKPSQFASNTLNPIRRIVDVMKLEPNPEKELIKLTIGDPTVFGNLRTAEECTNALVATAQDGKHNGYPNSVGYHESREAVAEYASLPEAPVTAHDVILTSGCSHALELVMSWLANPGQNILIPRPGFSLYKTLADSLGIETRYYNLMPDRNWEVDLQSMEDQIDEDTVAVLVNSPSNPCGGVFSRSHMEEIVSICDFHKLPIISDEVYEHVVFEGEEHIPFAAVSDTVPVFAVSAISKRFLLPGWRLGWVIVHNRNGLISEEMRSGLISLTQRILGPSSVVQGALPVILKTTPQSLFDNCNKLYQENAVASYELLSATRGLTPVKPSGAMYMMVGIDLDCFPDINNDVQFTERLMAEESVFCLPASCFAYPGFIRLVLCIPTEKVIEACVRIKEFCQRHFMTIVEKADHLPEACEQPNPRVRKLQRVATSCYLKV